MAEPFALILAQLNCAFTKQGIHTFDFPKLLLVKMQYLHDWLHSFDATILFLGLVLTLVPGYGFLIIIFIIHTCTCIIHHFNTIIME